MAKETRKTVLRKIWTSPVRQRGRKRKGVRKNARDSTEKMEIERKKWKESRDS